MRKEDFKVGQNVYVYLLGNAARGKFRHSNHGNPREYELYPTKDELLNELWRRNVRCKISKYSEYSSTILERLNDKELETIYNILQKYAEDTK